MVVVTTAVKVLVLQEDGVMSNQSWAQSTTTTSPSPSASACIRFKVFFFRPLTHVFSLTSREQSREINGEIFVDYVRPIVSAAFYFLGISNPLQVLTWYHYCLTYDHTAAQISAYLDGDLQGVISRNTSRWFAAATLVLGQYSLEYLSSFTGPRSFSGQLTQAGVWGRTLTDAEVAQMADCGPFPAGASIRWDQEWILSNASFVDLPEDEICEKKTKSSYVKFAAMPYEAARMACAGLGGNLPVPDSLQHALEIIEAMSRLPVVKITWVGATDDLQEGVYVKAHNGEVMAWFKWGSNDPNGLQWQNCLVMEPDFLHDYPCHVSREALCFLAEQQEWTLKGPCEEDTANYKYSLKHPEKGKLVFRGYYQYEIVEEEEEWVWRNVITDTMIARMSFEEARWPMGRRNWTIESEVCERKGVQVLQLSSCTGEEYTCRDGSCIPRVQRCDRRPDCHDESDEQECQLVRRPVGYHHTLPPPSSVPGSPLFVGLKMKLVSLSLSDKDSYLEVTYHLNMTWIDLRLRFYNLKAASRLNQVPVTDHRSVWTPTLTLINVRGTERTRVDDEAILTVHRRGHPLDDDLSVPEDADVYLGTENHLSVDRKYTSNFLCDLNLELYPFDIQRCFMEMEVLSAATDFVKLQEHVSEVAYVGAELLIEYTVVSVGLRVNNSHTMGEAEVEVVLQRRVGYPIISIYVPTVILLILAYLSLVFRRDNFETRIMSSLTVLLTSTSLPKTSYFKMVDVWLLFCISLIFFVIVFHVIIDMAGDGKLTSDFSKIPTPSKVFPIGGNGKMPSPPLSAPRQREPRQIFLTRLLSAGGDTLEERRRRMSDKTFRYALIFIPAYFSLFNVIYWIYIFA
ncbi:Glutamate-gated chloride channel alpha [Chionoecetes opilio]|uniref:Glutamate-gated chloride channel alpha n=1 Tax=Chionoecetes opilio TaxID=41210 RepID=A0A8J4XZB0_CHIOP|nr:Glutamate-gated chloride channel alpha [Chionoecetes opilio]